MTWALSPSVPDVILPVQFYDRTGDSPEKRLIFAVLLDAIVQLQRGDASGAEAAERWIGGEIDDVPISFSDACEALGFDARSLARGLLAWRVQADVVLGIRPRPVPGLRRRVSAIGPTRRRGGVSSGRSGATIRSR